jgi:hypothetical protein
MAIMMNISEYYDETPYSLMLRVSFHVGMLRKPQSCPTTGMASAQEEKIGPGTNFWSTLYLDSKSTVPSVPRVSLLRVRSISVASDCHSPSAAQCQSTLDFVAMESTCISQDLMIDLRRQFKNFLGVTDDTSF